MEATNDTGEVHGLWLFMYKHRTLLVAYAAAVAPEWDKAPLEELWAYHAVVMAKALETVKGKRPPLRAIITADQEARVRWMLHLRQHKTDTVKDAISYVSKHFGHLWQHVHSTAVASSFISASESSTHPKGDAKSDGKGNMSWGKAQWPTHPPQ